MISKMSEEAKEYLRKALENGAVYTTPIRPLGVIYTKAIKETTVQEPYGKPCKSSIWTNIKNLVMKGR